MPDRIPPDKEDSFSEEFSQEQIASIAAQSAIPIVVMDQDLRYVFVNAAYCKAFEKSPEQLIGQRVFDVFSVPAGYEDSFRKNCARAFQGEITRSDVQTALVTRRDGRTRPLHWQVTFEPYRAADGHVRYIVQRVENVTHLIELQKSHDVVITELDHRVKNFVSVILATARITSLSADSVEQYTEDFCSRVDSMARIYGRMSAEGLKGLQLRELFEDELAQVAGKKAIQYSLSGDNVQLTMKATKDGGMVIHEFVTNALKHGCFSRPGGRLDVEWTVLGGMLRIMWVESGLSGIRPPEKVGFGTRLTDMLPNARVKREYHDTGLRIEYVVPLEFATKEIEEDDPWVTTD